MHATLAVRGISKFLALALALLLASCGGGGGGGDSGAGGGGPAPTFTLGGTVTGLAGSGLVLRNNGGDNLTVAANANNFTFSTSVASGAAYSVTVMTQPTNLSQTCVVTNGSGTMPGANVATVAVSCTTNTFTVGGTVVGHNGSGLTLVLNGGPNLNLSVNGTFAFGALPDGSAYNVLLTNSGTQACAVSNGSGTLAGANVANIVVTCVSNAYLVGGTVSGLSGSGLALQINGGNNTPVTTNGPFILGLPLVEGSLYTVTVSSQPTNPTQTCTVTNGSGFVPVPGANVTNVAVNCVTTTYKISGLVSGLAGTGLVLRNNGANDLSIPGNGTFEFTTQIASGAAYNVSVATQPANLSQTCTVTNGSGFVGSANINNVAVTCVTNTYTISGIVSGLSGTGLVLRNNGGNDLPVSANGTFAFTTPIASGGTYNVTPFTPPTNPSQTCTVTNGSGFVTNAHINNVSIACVTNTFTIGGAVSGLAGTGLVLQNNLGNNLAVSANGQFAFSTPILSGAAYSVTVLTQPNTPTQTCTVTSGSGNVGNGPVTTVAVACTTNSYTIGGTVSGLAGTGLVLLNNGGNNLPISGNGTFSFTTPIASGGTYNVSVGTQPTNLSQICTVTNGSGTVGGGLVNTVAISCATSNYTVGGTVSGHNGTGLTLRLNDTTNLIVPGNGPYNFSAIPDGSAYSVVVLVNPIAQTCTVTNPSGTLAGANVATVAVSCTNNFYPIGGTVSGLVGSGLVLQNNSGNNLPILANGAFSFSTSIETGLTYNVTISAQPTNPSQTCTVTSGSGTVGSSPVTSVGISCGTNSYTVGGTVSGHNGTGLTLRLNGTTNLIVSGNGPFAFGAIPDGSAYNVEVFVQPLGQTCTVTNPSGTLAGALVNNVAVSCTTNTYTIGGTVSGLVGTGLVLQNNAGNNLSISANGAFVFSTSITHGSAYAVTVLTHPSTPTQTCLVTSGSGTATANVTNVAVACTTNTYTIGGTITGLTGAGLVLQNNLGNNLTVLANATSFTFSAAIASGATYSVTVLTQPATPTQTCTVTGGGSGTVVAANVTTAVIACTTNTYTIGGTISGLTSSSVVLRNNGGNDLTVLSGATTFTFGAPIASGATYAVTVLTQPAGLTCTVTSGGSGTVGAINVTTVVIGCAALPAAPVPTLGFYVKQLQFSWAAVSGVTHYQLSENPDGISGYVQVGANIPPATLSVNHTIAVHRRLNASYIVSACNGAGCSGSAPMILGASLTSAIGYVKASNPDATDVFGVSISLSTDGNTLAIGAYLEDSNGSGEGDNSAINAGAVYVFARNTTTGIWSQQAYLKASNPGGGAPNPDFGDPLFPDATEFLPEGDQFGRAVALSGDGNTLAVGARNEDSAGLTLTPQADDCAPTPPPPATPPVMVNCAANSGAVYVFIRSGVAWSQQAYLKASNPGGGAYDLRDAVLNPEGINGFLPGDEFGFSVALNADGSTLAVGAPLEDSGNANDEGDNSAVDSGAVYVFTRSGANWTQQDYLKASNIDGGDQFGYSVALSGASGNGTTLAVGARLEEGSGTGVNPSVNDLASSAGAAYVFTRSGSNWSQQAYIKASNTEQNVPEFGGDEFGTSVALSTDGSTLAVGAPFEDSNGSSPADNSAFNSGAVYVYTRNGAGVWSHQAYIKASNPGGGVDNTDEGDDFGRAVALSGDGNTLAVGAPMEDSNATGIGGNQADNSNENAGAVYVYTRSGTTWTQQAYVKVTPGFDETFTAFDSFGASVALSSDGSTLAAGADHQEGGGQGINPTRDIDTSLAGAVYLY